MFENEKASYSSHDHRANGEHILVLLAKVLGNNYLIMSEVVVSKLDNGLVYKLLGHAISISI